jgi:hypothetical protein
MARKANLQGEELTYRLDTLCEVRLTINRHLEILQPYKHKFQVGLLIIYIKKSQLSMKVICITWHPTKWQNSFWGDIQSFGVTWRYSYISFPSAFASSYYSIRISVQLTFLHQVSGCRLLRTVSRAELNFAISVIHTLPKARNNLRAQS